jgi:hypothetical protein
MRQLRSLVVIAAFALPTIAHASPPSPANSTTPLCISLVGSKGSVPAPIGQFTCIIRDLANNPVVGAVVVIDLSSCPDLFICAEQLDPAATVDCVHKTVTKLADANGSVNFTILGGSNGGGNAVTLLGGGRIFENGTLIQNPTVSAYDLDGSGGVGTNDLSAWLGDFGSGVNYGRSDFDCSTNIGANDLAFWLTAWGSEAMVTSCVSHCP